VAVAVILGAVPAFGQAQKGKPSIDPCKNFDWLGELEADQALILSKVPLHVANIEQALAPGGALQDYTLAHLFAEQLGNGTTLSLKDQSQFGRPDFVLQYAGSPQAVSVAIHPLIPKNPYTLVGWAYLVEYDPSHPEPPAQTQPGFAKCIPKQDWLIHEAGFHLFDGGFQPTPGVAPPGPALPPTAFLWHPRLWDLHVWVNLCGSPRVGYLDQLPDGRLVSGAGHSAPTGSYFYPPITDPDISPMHKRGQVQGPTCSPIDN